MARVLFVLGAGASQSTGAPLMRDFMARIRDLRSGNLPQEHRPAFDLVWKGFLALKNVHANVQMNYQGNIEDLFATFEMARLLGRLGNLESSQLQSLPDAMKEVIATTIELGMPFPVGSDGWIHPHPVYDKFARLIRLSSATLGQSLAILTFNYDIGLDYALSTWSVPFDYCIPSQPAQGVPLLKLHGSLNWRSSPDQQQVSYISIAPRQVDGAAIGSSKVYLRASKWDEHLHPGSRPFIVPPTWNKTQYHEKIDRVWTRAAQEFADTVMVFIIGYSAPSTDEFFRHLFALGLAGGGVMDRIWVVNTDRDAFTRIKDMLSAPLQGTAEYISGDFLGQMERLALILGIEGDALVNWREGKV